MKTPVRSSWFLGLVLALTTVSAGWAQHESKPESILSPKPVSTPPRTPDLPEPTTVTLTAKQPLPANLKLSPWATEIVKLAEAGIQDDVMLSFIDNAGTFNLGADQIIYLSDLGVSSEVVSAMLQHDQQLLSGTRPVTISSDPVDESINELLKILRAANAAASNRPPAVQMVTPPAPATPAPPRTAATPKPNPFPQVSTYAATPQAAPGQPTKPVTAPMPMTGFRGQTQPAALKKDLYPTRSPHTEEMATIYIIRAHQPTANVIVVERFP